MNFKNLLFLCIILAEIANAGCSELHKRGNSGKSYAEKEDLGRVLQGTVPAPWDFPCLIIGYCRACIRNKDLKCCRCADKTCDCYKKKCFPANANVKLESGESVPMSEIQIGDKIQTVLPGGGVATFSEVRTFLMKDHTVTNEYKSITTFQNDTISLTGNHLIYARNDSTKMFSPVFADEVSVGDEVLVQKSDELTPTMVINVFNQNIQGAYVPLTKEGNIVVDGVLVSCYASFDHDMAHFTMTPMVWFLEITAWIFGENNGSPTYADIAKHLGKWLLPHKFMYPVN